MTHRKTVYSRVSGAILLLLAISFFSVSAQQVAKRSPGGTGYLLHLPENYSTTEVRYPLLVFLHGIDEKGNGSAADLQKIKAYGPPMWIEKGHNMRFEVEGKEYSYLVVSPQLSEEANGWSMRSIDELITHITSTYRVDETRIYLTGLSMGGNGTWRYGFDDRNSPPKVAAIAPVSGWGNPAKACKIAEGEVAVWAFHGENDRVIPVSRDNSMVKALRACQGRSVVNYTVYENTGHDSWTKAYDPTHSVQAPNVYEWLLQHSLKVSNTEKKGAASLNTEKKRPQPPKQASPRLQKVATLPAALKETSGLWVESPNRIWSHNDSGGQPVLYLTDTLGNVVDMKIITNAFNLDWEDLARDDRGNVYIGDFGNNRNNRRALQVFKIPNPSEQESSRIPAEKIEFTYPDQKAFPPDSTRMNYDMEAMVYLKNHLYLFSKNRTVPYSGITKIYKIPTIPGNYEAELIDSLSLGGNMRLETWLGGAAISPDESHIALLGYDKLFLLSCFKPDKFSSATLQKISLGGFSQKEGIDFINDTEIYITDEVSYEVIGGNLYHFDLSSFMYNCEE
ncbi:alpha/beta hydrolase-fold protein [Roseivirga sp. BDSF3-8]|uniref:alpha/beta hydrolase-fold protein n=1 Tax=Roseivirga sp. BDSF3-8 TaxID=3241598 RepID=UPI003532170D